MRAGEDWLLRGRAPVEYKKADAPLPLAQAFPQESIRSDWTEFPSSDSDPRLITGSETRHHAVGFSRTNDVGSASVLFTRSRRSNVSIIIDLPSAKHRKVSIRRPASDS